MEEYYRWQIEQLRATVAQQEEIIISLTNAKLKEYIREEVSV